MDKFSILDAHSVAKAVLQTVPWLIHPLWNSFWNFDQSDIGKNRGLPMGQIFYKKGMLHSSFTYVLISPSVKAFEMYCVSGFCFLILNCCIKNQVHEDFEGLITIFFWLNFFSIRTFIIFCCKCGFIVRSVCWLKNWAEYKNLNQY